MALDDIEIADRFRLVDSGAVADGAFAHAHVQRAVTRSHNRLVDQGEALLSLSWPSMAPASAEDAAKSIRLVGNSRWSRAHPGIWQRPKKHGLRKADVFVRAAVTLDERAHLAIGTLRSRPLERAVEGDPNVLTMIGTGALADYVLRDLPIDPGSLERFRFFARCQPKLGTVADPTDYTAGGVATGQIYSLWEDGQVTVAASPSVGAPLWNFEGSGSLTWAPTHALVIHDGDSSTIGNTLWWGQFAHVLDPVTAKLIPGPPTEDFARRVPGRWYYVAELPQIRIVHVSIFANDRSS
jgi:hypothetical protein